MQGLKRFWRSLFDVRPGEYAKTGLMSLYLMLVLFAYYILKPVSRALFLNNFDIDKLPWLYVLIAGIGGLLTYFYTKLALRTSLSKAVTIANVFCVVVLCLFWWLIQLRMPWVIYAFNIWVSLFSIMLVSQGWLVAANVFTSREAKRLYGILGVGSVIGAAFGGQFTAVMVYYVGTTNLVIASAVMVVLSYIAYRMAMAAAGKDLGAAKGAEEGEEFSIGEIFGHIRRLRHLQVIVAIIIITFVVDVLVEFQFSAFAKQTYQGRDLTAFLGNFYGFWLNLVTFVLQLFLTNFVVSRFGVGGTLQIMPVSIAAASLGALLAPSLLSTAATRLTEASTRYSFNKTGTELLYLPLPLELRNRVKAFVDVFVDRVARGLGGMILVLFTAVAAMKPEHFSMVVLALAVVWVFLSIIAQREYVATVRRRLELRRLDLENARITVSDRETIRLLERTAREGTARQAAYALELLSQAPGYQLDALTEELVRSPHAEVRGKVYELARRSRNPALLEATLSQIRNARDPREPGAVREAVLYAIAVSDEPAALARRLFEHIHPAVPPAVVDALAERGEGANEVLDHDWLEQAARDPSPARRALAARAVGVRGDAGTDALYRLLNDQDASVVKEAIRASGVLKNREYLAPLVRRLADPQLRGAAVEALAGFGPKIIGTLGDLLEDESVDLPIRRNIPRVLRNINDQRSVDLLIRTLPVKDLGVRTAVLKALSKMREAFPNLNYETNNLIKQVHEEARSYFENHGALAAVRTANGSKPATTLLVRTLEDRLNATLDRLFRLIGLKYPPRQIYAAYLAVNRRNGEEFAAALDFLDNVLERELKRVMIPLLDEDSVLAQRGQELFSIEPVDAKGAIRSLIHSGDIWLASCAMAAAAELTIREVAPDIRTVGDSGGKEVAHVARAAEAALARA
jgi:AAA family ATP:ADP antiporter